MCNSSRIAVDDTLVIFQNGSIFTERNLRTKSDSRNRWLFLFLGCLGFFCLFCFVVHRHYITSGCYEMPLRGMLTDSSLGIHPMAARTASFILFKRNMFYISNCPSKSVSMSITCIWMKDDFHEWKLKKKKKSKIWFQPFPNVWKGLDCTDSQFY